MKDVYETPTIEIVEVDDAIFLTTSDENDSLLDFGNLPD